MGATVLPELHPQHIGVQVGRWQHLCAVASLTAAQGKRLERLPGGQAALRVSGGFSCGPGVLRGQAPAAPDH